MEVGNELPVEEVPFKEHGLKKAVEKINKIFANLVKEFAINITIQHIACFFRNEYYTSDEEEFSAKYFEEKCPNRYMQSEEKTVIEEPGKLLIFKGIDIDGNKAIDVVFGVIFNVPEKATYSNKQKWDNIDDQLFFVESAFSSPVVGNYLKNEDIILHNLELKAKQELMASHTHGLKNLSFINSLNSIYTILRKENLDDNVKLGMIKKRFEQRLLYKVILKDIVSALFYRKLNNRIELNLEILEIIKSPLGMIEIFLKGFFADEYTESSINNSTEFAFQEKDIENYLNIISNIFYNISNYYANTGELQKTINVDITDTEICIENILYEGSDLLSFFDNKGQIKEEDDIVKNKSGLRFIASSVEALNTTYSYTIIEKVGATDVNKTEKYLQFKLKLR